MSPVTVAFVLDTKVEMNQTTSAAMTFIDCAKSAIEHFIKASYHQLGPKVPPSPSHLTLVLITTQCDEAWGGGGGGGGGGGRGPGPPPPPNLSP